jgi:hypothetical protein
MLYLGLPLYSDEIARLLKDVLKGWSSASGFNHLLERCTSIRVYDLDKYVMVLGFELNEFRSNLWGPTRSVEELAALLQLKKGEWMREMKKLGVDLSSVTLARMEDEDEVVQNPEPFLMEW